MKNKEKYSEDHTGKGQFSMIDFEWYRSFIAIYKHNSVSEAAKTRIMTQPAMSQHLASLEAEVGEVLFTRTPRKMIPTERGKELYSEVAPLIEALEEASMSLKSTSIPTLTVMKIGSAHEFFLEKILPWLHKYPIRTVSHFGTADHLVELLKEEKVDLIISSKKYHAPGIEYVKVMDEEFVVIAPRDLELPEIENLKAQEQWLASQNWLSYGLELPIIRRFWREHFKQRPTIKPAHVIPNLHMILQAIENGAGISLLPTYIVNKALHQGKVQVIVEELTVKNEVYLAYQMKNKHLPEIRQMIQIIREAVTNEL